MTFLMLEIMNHAYAQINSFSYRKHRGRRMARRVLKSIVITTPSGMSRPEKEIYHQRLNSAFDTFHHVRETARQDRPKLILDFDEATCIQLTYLYGEITHRFLGEAHTAIATLGRPRTGDKGVKQNTFRLASIDIGGGTTDLMIAEYAPSAHDPAGVRQKMLFTDGFNLAGDDIAKRIIEKVILKQVFDFAKERTPTFSWEEFQAFFGPGKAGRDKKFLDEKAELCR